MELNMYEFEGGEIIWICAESKEQAISIFKRLCGDECWEDGVEQHGDDAVREMSRDEEFSYYHDGRNADKDTIGNHIRKYCTKPDVFATSSY